MVGDAPTRKILQVVHGFVPECHGGTEHYVLECSLALKARGHDVRVLTGSMESRPAAVLEQTETEGLPVTRLHRAGLFVDNWEKSYDPDATRLFGEVLAGFRPDIVHV